MRQRLADSPNAGPRELASKPSLEISDDGSMVVWNNSRGDWRVGRADDGLRLGAFFENKNQAHAFPNTLSEIRTEDGGLVDWGELTPDEARTMRVVRDGRTESLADTVRRIEAEARGGLALDQQRAPGRRAAAVRRT